METCTFLSGFDQSRVFVGAPSVSKQHWTTVFAACCAMYMGKIKDAEDLLGNLKRQNRKSTLPCVVQTYVVFLEGLVGAVLAFRSKDRHYRKRLSTAHKKLKLLKSIGVNQRFTLWNKIFLLEAQIHACRGQYENALLCFHTSVDLADREGLSQEQGLAYELAAEVCKREHRDIEADLYLSQSKQLYAEWGARAKVDQLKRRN